MFLSYVVNQFTAKIKLFWNIFIALNSLPMQVRESLASFLPSGHAQEPPSSELRHTYSQSSEAHRLLAARKRN
jgi:hypothetical protein